METHRPNGKMKKTNKNKWKIREMQQKKINQLKIRTDKSHNGLSIFNIWFDCYCTKWHASYSLRGFISSCISEQQKVIQSTHCDSLMYTIQSKFIRLCIFLLPLHYFDISLFHQEHHHNQHGMVFHHSMAGWLTGWLARVTNLFLLSQ